MVENYTGTNDGKTVYDKVRMAKRLASGDTPSMVHGDHGASIPVVRGSSVRATVHGLYTREEAARQAGDEHCQGLS